MKLTSKAIAWLILTSTLWLSGCSNTDTYIPPKEGDIVTWKWAPQLVFKARLGQRRIHIPDKYCTRCEREFYKPQYDRFLGQFPIDYVPERFDKLTSTEIENLPPTRSNSGAIEFSLMLNGAKGKATDGSPHGENAMDDINQVKVFIYVLNLEIQEKIKGHTPYNTKQFFELELMKELDVNTKASKNGIDCYEFKSRQGGKHCFGKSENASVSGFRFYVSPDIKNNILVYSNEYTYGGIELQWFTHQKNMYSAREIDAAIWRFLETWNVASIQSNN